MILSTLHAKSPGTTLSHIQTVCLFPTAQLHSLKLQNKYPSQINPQPNHSMLFQLSGKEILNTVWEKKYMLAIRFFYFWALSGTHLSGFFA